MNKQIILCVDDEQFVLNALNKQLQRHFGDHFEYEFAESAEEAMEILEELTEEGEVVAMVISDQIMPGIPGDRFLVEIHKTMPHAVKVMLSGQVSSEALENVEHNAALYRLINKPWKEEELTTIIQTGLAQFNG